MWSRYNKLCGAKQIMWSPKIHPTQRLETIKAKSRADIWTYFEKNSEHNVQFKKKLFHVWRLHAIVQSMKKSSTTGTIRIGKRAHPLLLNTHLSTGLMWCPNTKWFSFVVEASQWSHDGAAEAEVSPPGGHHLRLAKNWWEVDVNKNVWHRVLQ